MAEYKNVEPLKRQIADFKRAVKSENSDYLTGYISALSAVEGMIAGQPAADVAPVVRCKDCKCAQTNNFGVSSNIVLCCLETSKSVRQMDDFCSYGERKELDDGKIH